MEIKEKVYAYIICHGQLLVFRHLHFSEAGFQVPGGTLEPGELPSDGALRETAEETGPTDLRLVRMLGEQTIDVSPWGVEQIHHRRFALLACGKHPPGVWQLAETLTSSGGSEPTWF